MQKAIIGFVGAGLVLVGGWYVLGQSGTESAMKTEEAAMEKAAMEEKMKMEEAAMMKDDTMMSDEAMQKDMMKDDAMKMEGDAMMKDKGVYVPYDAAKVAMAASGDVVLFFKASWCPSCRTLDSDITANLGAIPAGLTILEVDYDKASDLKQKYGVTTQHTLVQVDASGNLIKKWNGGNTLASVVAQVQ